MKKNMCRQLDRVAESVNQLIDQTIDLLVLKTQNPDQLVLNVTREQALRGLQQLLHDELASPQASGERVWRLVSSILAMAISYVLDTESDSIQCNLCREQSRSAFIECATVHGCTKTLEADHIMEVGRTIKFLRISAGLRQSDLAERLGVSSNYISLVENGKRDPSLSFLRDLSDELEIPLGLLFLEVGSDRDSTSPQIQALLTRIRDLVLQIEQMRLQGEG